MIQERLERLADLASNEFSDLLRGEPLLMETKLRLHLKDGSFVEIRYPLNTEYSFHWQRDKDPIRVNTAPDHPEIESFPRHIHIGSRIAEDKLTDISLEPEENLRRFLIFVRDKINME